MIFQYSMVIGNCHTISTIPYAARNQSLDYQCRTALSPRNPLYLKSLHFRQALTASQG